MNPTFFDQVQSMMPPARIAGTVEIRKFSVDRPDVRIANPSQMGRGVRPGNFTGLYRKGRLWMSDTHDEVRDTMLGVACAKPEHGPWLVSGLGLGTLLAAAVIRKIPHVAVIEIDAEVIAAVGDHWRDLADRVGMGLSIHHADALEWQPPKGVTYGWAFHDICQNIDEDNLASMKAIRRHYQRFMAAPQRQWCWSEHLCKRMRRHSAACGY